MKTVRTILLCCILFAAGCASLRLGRPIPQTALQQIRSGFTTRDDIVALLGMPWRSVPGDGGDIWVYRYLDGRRLSQELVISFCHEERVSAWLYR